MQRRASAKPVFGNVLVVGGTGFLGHHVVKLLVERYTVASISVIDRSVSRNRRPDSDGVRYYEADITSMSSLTSAFAEIRPDVVIHTASPIPQTDVTPPRALYDAVNVGGTRNIVKACQSHGVKALVYTSSASVICDHSSAVINADETWPPVRGANQPEYYTESKAQAEDLVIAANRRAPFPLRTAVIRPSAIIGEGDVMIIPRFIDIYNEGKHYFQLGSNENLFDFTYAGNVAHGHLLAAEALLDSSRDGVDGECFFITNDSPVYFWDFARAVWIAAGCRYDMRRVWIIPEFLATILAFLCEVYFAVVRKPATFNSRRVAFSCTTRYYDISKAKDRLGYEPLVTLQEGVRRSVTWCNDNRKATEPRKAVVM
ncbi:sterol-4-alpha-carboxylate 3-dehydrogenase [Xylariomycetidae sp. FL2044]|nr:sterol-4-alpha-carboxylate 3-dehydrogenase [Xylariomycetidae sp. FL2044]